MAGKIPYLWVNHLLLGASAGLICLSIALLIASFVFRRFRKSRWRWAALTSFVFGLLLAGSSHIFLFSVQLPAYSRGLIASNEARREASSLVKLGEQAPAFSVKNLEGTEIALDRLRGKTVLLVFFATWCGPCNQELPHVEQIWKANQNRPDFALVAIGREETAEKLAAFKIDHGYTFPIASDPKRSVYSLYAKELIPRIYMIGPDGTICFTSTGFGESRLTELQEQLEKQLATKDEKS
jgi:peroxiredoxin